MSRGKVLVFLPYVNGLPGMENRHFERMRLEAPDFAWVRVERKADFLRELPGARAALVWAFPREWSAAAAGLELLATPAAGRDWVDIAPREGLRLSFGSFHGALMSETVLGLMLAFNRGIKDCLDRRSEAWPREEVGRAMRLLRGSHAVIVGFGNIGKWIGRALVPLGVRVTGVNRRNLERPDYFGPRDRVIAMEGLDGVLPEADHLIVVLPGGDGSDGVIGARRLALLPGRACLYNVGRGNAVDMDALAAALEAGALRGAGLDVFPTEPLPEDAPIRRRPNAILMPHVSAFGPEYMDLFLDEFLPGLGGMLPGAPAEK